MDDTTSLQSQADFEGARNKALFRRVVALLTGQRNELLSFEAVKEKLRLGGPIYRGVRSVRVEDIVGSLNRYHDFDRAFLPAHAYMAARWQRVNRAWYEDVSLPPVLLYQVGEAYFVVDGHHRVSVARQQQQAYIDAEVRECAVKVPITPALRPQDLELMGEKVNFLERTALDRVRPQARIDVTVLGGYERLLEHIAVHRYFMGLDIKRDIDEGEAVGHWHDHVYQPAIKVLREGELLAALPGKTEADFYLWVMDHRHYLVARGRAALAAPGRTAEEFVRHFWDRRVWPGV